MNGFGAFVIICTLLYCGISWVVPRVLAWLCKRRFHVEVRVGRIALPSLKLRDVSVRSSGFSVHVDEIGLRSSVFGGDESKLLAVVVRDVRINRDISGSSGGGARGTGGARGRKGLPPDLRGARVPPALLSLAQFMALHVQGATAMLLHARAPAPWLVHAAAAELRLDGSVVQGARALLVSAALRGASAKLLRHVPDAHATAGPARPAPAPGHAPKPAAAPAPRARARARNAAASGRGQGDRAAQPSDECGGADAGAGASADAEAEAAGAGACLGEVALGLALEATLSARGPLSVERLYVAMEHTRAVVHEGLCAFLAGAAHAKHGDKEEPDDDDEEEEPEQEQQTEAQAAAAFEEALRRLEPILPKSLQVRVQETALTGARGAGRPELVATLRRLQLSSQCQPAAPVGALGLGLGLGLSPGPAQGHTSAPSPPPPPPPPPPPLPSASPVGLHAAPPPPQLFASAQLEGLSVRCGRDPAALQLSKLSLSSKLEEGVLNVFVALEALSAVYDHAALRGWLAERRPSGAPPGPAPPLALRTSRPRSSRSRGPGLLGRLLAPLQVRGCVEASSVAALARLPSGASSPTEGDGDGGGVAGGSGAPRCASLRCARAKLALEQAAGARWAAELLLEQLGCALDEAALAADAADGPGPGRGRFHTWGAPLTLGSLLARLRREEDPQGASAGARLSASADGLRVELSPELATAALLALRCLQDYRALLPPPPPPASSPTSPVQDVRERDRKDGLGALLADCHVTASLANANAFFLADARAHGHAHGHATGPDAKVCVAVRVDTASLERAGGRVSAAAEGAKVLAPARGPRAAFACLRAADAAGGVAHARRLRLTARVPSASRPGQLQLQLLDDVEVAWSCALHLRLLALLRELRAFRAALPPSFRPPSTPTPAAPTKRAPWTVNVRAQGRLSASACAGPRRPAATLTGQEVVLSTGPGEWVLTSPALALAVDGAELFRASQLDVRRLRDSAEVRLERRNAEGFTLAWNERCWAMTLGSFKAVFPYQHRFAEVFQDELMSIVRWLRLTHRRPPTAAPREEHLPPDLVIKIREFLFEMSDDPFEVRLRDNLELLEDECRESARRQKMLDAKVAELCKQHLLLPSGKVEELYASLSKKNAQIYVQRSQQMARSAPPRTRLFAWQMSAVEIVSLADPAVSTRAAAAAAAAAMDPDAPAPEGGLRFSTLWCRAVSAACAEWTFQLRDFPQPLLHIRGLRLWGRLAGAEQEAPPRARRTVVLHLGEPWGDAAVERTMTSLKFYHDLNCDVDLYSYAFGPCWEPVIAQCNLSFEKIVMPSRDPSVPLPFWDKMRLLLHGRLTMCVRQMTVLLHASLDPYNTTEEMELTWRDVAMDWTSAKVVFKGELNVYVRTASKYDDCRLLHLPNLRLTLKLQWVCLGDPNDHHSVFPCAPDKLPEYSSNQEHDSFRAFRSQNLNLSVALETKPLARSSNAAPAADVDCPVVLLYGSTLRWFENLKLILSGVTRPTRRGAVFGNVRPRKPQLSRHYRRLHLLLGLHRFQVCYWMSFAMQRGCEMLGGRISCSSEHTLTLVPVDDGLKHRPRADWAIAYMNCELNDAEIWLKSALPEDPESGGAEAGQPVHAAMRPPVEKCYCLSVAKVSYGREALLPAGGDTPTHRLVVYDLKGAWTKSNRDVAFALFDAFVKTKQLKKNLSTEALKGFRAEPSSTPKAARGRAAAAAAATDAGSLTPAPPGAAGTGTEVVAAAAAGAGVDAAKAAAAQATPSPMSKLQSGVAASMLQRLIAEADNKAVVFSDDPSAAPGDGEPQLLGRAACREDDALHKNWLIALVNSQVLLKGCETKGYVILSAAKAEILQRVHRPVWKARTPVSKTTWVGSLECMQYYATVAAGDADALNDNIMWLTVDNIQERGQDAAEHISELPDVPHLVGSGRSVGGVVSETVGATAVGCEGGAAPLQLQRIVSRCRCEFFYACYGESSVDPAAAAELPPPPPPYEDGSGAGPWERRDPAVDAFTLMHHDLEVCTNSLQYAMVLDVVNNLLLYVEPRRKEASARLQRMRFQLQLHSVEDQRRPIQQLQNKVRSMVSKLRRLERESYLLERAAAELDADINEEAYRQEMEDLDRQINECKEQLNAHSEELDMMISCYKETQLSANQKLATMRGDKPVTIVRANEIVFKHAQWRLTQADGQLGIADLVLSNFLYTKNSKSDDSGEHLLEVGYVRMTNLLPNQVYKEVLSPTEIQSNMPVDRKRAVRVFCREKAPVGGISVKEHFEINVVPITIGLTKKFFNTMLKFCFPERDPDTIEGEGSEDLETEGKSKKGKKAKGKEASFYVPIDPKDDVEKMKERAEKNKLFIYIKIPEVPVKVSYKGNKDKNLEDIRDFSLVIPTLEYHNVTWTWLDLLLAMKNDSRRVILSQAIKQKLQIKMHRAASDDSASPQEEDKARMLFGSRLMPGDGRSLKKGVFKLSK